MKPEFEKLIDIAIVDGNISEGKKDFLLKKAIELGVDLAELEMVINVKLFQNNQNFKTEEINIFSEKAGKIEKCSNCNAVINPLDQKCNVCGNEIKNSFSNQSLKEFLNKIDSLDKSKKADIAQISELITNYPVPNNKKDLFEFLTICIPQIEDYKKARNKGEKKINRAWLLKSRQLLIKAKGLYKDDPDFINKIKAYELKVEERIRAIRKVFYLKTTIKVLIFALLIFVTIIYIPKFFEKKSSYDLYVDSINKLYGYEFNEIKNTLEYKILNKKLKDIYCSNFYDSTLDNQIEEFNNACTIASDIHFFGIALSQDLDYQSERELANKYIDTTLALNPNFAFAYNFRGEMLFKIAIDNAYTDIDKSNNASDSAFNYFNKAISIRQDCWKFYFNRSRVYAKRKSPSDAINDIMSALKLNPNDIELLFFRAMYLIALNGSSRDWCSDFNELKTHKDFELLYEEHWSELDKVFEACNDKESYYFSYDFN